MQQLNTSRFAYHAGTFSAELSTLGDGAFNSMFGKVFDDGQPLPRGASYLDEGFWLTSERTSEEVRMVFYKIHHDRENDITHWEWRPYDCKSFRSLIIYND